MASFVAQCAKRVKNANAPRSFQTIFFPSIDSPATTDVDSFCPNRASHPSIHPSIQRLEDTFADDILLGGGFWRRSQRYWGHISGNKFILHGPKAYRQFCFRTRGALNSQGEQLVVQLLIQLSRRDIYGLLYTLAFILVGLPIVLRWWGVQLMPLYL